MQELEQHSNYLRIATSSHKYRVIKEHEINRFSKCYIFTLFIIINHLLCRKIL